MVLVNQCFRNIFRNLDTLLWPAPEMYVNEPRPTLSSEEGGESGCGRW